MTLKNINKLIEWLATMLVLAGIALSAVDIYPLNITLSLVGNGLWCLTSCLWRKWSLLIMSVVICIINLAGLAHYYLQH